MSKKKGFTLIELLVVIAIIALLMAILMPALAKVRRQAMGAACMATTKQWATVYSMYTGDSDGFFAGDYQSDTESGNSGSNVRKQWWVVLEPYYKDKDTLLCPAATKTEGEGASGPYRAYPQDSGNGYIISLSYNGWMGKAEDPDAARSLGRTPEWRWATVNRTKQPTMVPIIGDTIGYARKFVHAYTDPKEFTDPDFTVTEAGTSHPDRLLEYRIRRHGPMTSPNVDMAFADFSVRPIGLKALWSLNWHRNWKQERIDAGMGKMLDNLTAWPEFMQGYSDDGVLDYE